MIHSALISPRSTASKRSTALRPGVSATVGACQKSADEVAMGGVGEFEMGGELVGEASDLAAAHGVGLGR